MRRTQEQRIADLIDGEALFDAAGVCNAAALAKKILQMLNRSGRVASARAEAIEECARIVDDWCERDDPNDAVPDIADRIRALS